MACNIYEINSWDIFKASVRNVWHESESEIMKTAHAFDGGSHDLTDQE